MCKQCGINHPKKFYTEYSGGHAVHYEVCPYVKGVPRSFMDIFWSTMMFICPFMAVMSFAVSGNPVDLANLFIVFVFSSIVSTPIALIYWSLAKLAK